ncbi:Ral GTPase-activating protein subunit alpha-1, partial [Kappamyces sp. JEL0680]
EYRTHARDLTISLCSYITGLLKSENLVPLQSRIVRSIDLLSRWCLLGDWIIVDTAVQKLVISCLSRGITILDRDHAFSNVHDFAIDVSPTKSSLLSPTTLQALGKLSETLKAESIKGDTMLLPTGHNASASFSSSPATQRGKKQQSRISIAPPKRFPKLRLSYQPSTSNMVSTGSKDGGIGLPTFAVLSTEIQIKSAAESAMSMINLRLGNFPASQSCFGVSQLHSVWDEAKQALQLTALQHRLTAPDEPNLSLAEDCKLVHYFAYQKRMIIAIAETPDWTDSASGPRVPSMVFLSRDSGGKFSWMGEFQYQDNAGQIPVQQGNLGSLQSIIGHAVDHSHVFEKWKQYEPVKTHFIPSCLPKQPEQTTLTRVRASNEENLVALPECIENPQLFQHILDCAKEHEELEDSVVSQQDWAAKFHEAQPFPKIDTCNPQYIPKNFRLFLGTLGFLEYNIREHLVPLPITEGLLQDLEKLDEMPERDNFMIEVFYFQSVQDVPDNLIRAVDMSSKEFESFLWSLGWGVDLFNHKGFMGTLKPEEYPVAPYFATMTAEVIFKSPYLMKRDYTKKHSLSMPISKSSSSINSAASSALVDEPRFNMALEPASPPKRVRSVTLGSTSAFGKLQEMAEPETISIVWLEDIHNISHLILQLPKHIIGCIMVHPLQNSGGLYYIRILLKVGVPDECMASAASNSR